MMSALICWILLVFLSTLCHQPTEAVGPYRSDYDDSWLAASWFDTYYADPNDGVGISGGDYTNAETGSSNAAQTNSGRTVSSSVVQTNTGGTGSSWGTNPSRFRNPSVENTSYETGTTSGQASQPVGGTEEQRKLATPYECDECDGKFRSERALLEHKNAHHSARDTHCYECNYTYASKKSYLGHIRKRHREIIGIETEAQKNAVDPAKMAAVTPFACPSCPRRFGSKKTLTAHVKSHTTDKTTCKLCGLVCSSRDCLVGHMKNTHPGEPIPGPQRPGTHKCTVCERVYSSHASLRQHKTTHKSNATYCKHCDRTLATRTSFRNHMHSRHPKFAQAEAEAAKERFLREHPEECDKCHKRFKDKQTLLVHSTLHDETTTCYECNKYYTRRATLVAHNKEKHQPK